MKYLIFVFTILIPFYVFSQKIDISNNWKFHTGDDSRWSATAFNDADWKNISAAKIWELSGYENYDGYAWYRTKVIIPSTIKENAIQKDSLIFSLGKIDDCDQVFLNGQLIGQDAGLTSNSFEDCDAWSVFRKYIISANHPAILWNKENVISIRVFDRGGGGGLYSGNQYVGMKDISDFVIFDLEQTDFHFKQNKNINNTITLKNINPNLSFKCILNIKEKNYFSEKISFEKDINFVIDPNKKYIADIDFKAEDGSYVCYTLYSEKHKEISSTTLEVPYILAPAVEAKPRINCAHVYGVRPGSPFLFYIAATGERPMKFSVSDLPSGLKFNENTGIVTGNINKRGEYLVKLTAENKFGKTSQDLKIICGDKIALTPPMGWNSWNCWGLNVSSEKIIQSANAMISSGLINHGWTYINIDDGWELDHKNQNIVTNEKFPDMKALSDDIHSKGMKIGIYSSPGPKTCGGFEGSFMYENSDAKAYDNWDIDYLKYDWCSYSRIVSNPTLEQLIQPYKEMQKALSLTHRDIVYSLCQYGMGDVWKWGKDVNGNLWRTTSDIEDTWESMSGIGFSQNKCSPYATPGNWNDPDMLVVGKVGWGINLHKTRLNINEQYTHISLWALLSAPLLIGCDLEQLDEFTLNLLTNDEIIAIDQDPLGKQAIQVIKTETYEIWMKELEDGSKAVGLFNKSKEVVNIDLNFSEIQLKGKQSIRDLWRQKNIGVFENKLKQAVLPHGVIMLKLTSIH